MSELRELQQALAKILTNDRLRARYLDGRQSALPNGLEVDLHSLDSLKACEIERSSETLVRKRVSQIRTMLPNTARALGKNYRLLCREYALSTHINGMHAIERDAIGFSIWLAKQSEIADWIVELAKWEVLDGHWAIRSFQLKIHRFHFDFASWFADGRDIENPPSKRRRLALLWRCGRWGRIVWN